jgi:capsid protein
LTEPNAVAARSAIGSTRSRRRSRRDGRSNGNGPATPAQILARHYEGAASSHRTAGWRKPATDANAAIGPGLAPLRQAVRDLVRNNPYAAAALASIVNETIGWGIVPKSTNARAMALWKKWAESKDCDADGQHDFYGLEKITLRTIAESGEVLVRRRFPAPVGRAPDPDATTSTRA